MFGYSFELYQPLNLTVIEVQLCLCRKRAAADITEELRRKEYCREPWKRDQGHNESFKQKSQQQQKRSIAPILANQPSKQLCNPSSCARMPPGGIAALGERGVRAAQLALLLLHSKILCLMELKIARFCISCWKMRPCTAVCNDDDPLYQYFGVQNKRTFLPIIILCIFVFFAVHSGKKYIYDMYFL